MSFEAAHIGFVIASYAISALVIIVLILTHIRRSRQCDQRLDELEGQDMLRQSGKQVTRE